MQIQVMYSPMLLHLSAHKATFKLQKQTKKMPPDSFLQIRTIDDVQLHLH